MVDLLVDAGKVKDREAALNAIIEREQKMSTGMQHGIAIPHGKSPAAGKLMMAIVKVYVCDCCEERHEGIDFAALFCQVTVNSNHGSHTLDICVRCLRHRGVLYGDKFKTAVPATAGEAL